MKRSPYYSIIRVAAGALGIAHVHPIGAPALQFLDGVAAFCGGFFFKRGTGPKKRLAVREPLFECLGSIAEPLA
jgi:hypothetical protein